MGNPSLRLSEVLGQLVNLKTGGNVVSGGGGGGGSNIFQGGGSNFLQFRFVLSHVILERRPSPVRVSPYSH